MPISRHTPLKFSELKNKHRQLRDGFHPNLVLRIHRALSWLQRAELANDDLDAKFIFLWISFNAVYAQDVGSSDLSGERSAFRDFFDAVVKLDTSKRIYASVWQRFSNEIRLLLNNQHVFAPFWNYQNGLEGFENWAESLATSQKVIALAMAQQDTPRLLAIVFDRLYVLRNQLVHGGATWNSSVNRRQVIDGGTVLGTIMPLFIDIMMENPNNDWGKPYYPVVK